MKRSETTSGGRNQISEGTANQAGTNQPTGERGRVPELTRGDRSGPRRTILGAEASEPPLELFIRPVARSRPCRGSGGVIGSGEGSNKEVRVGDGLLLYDSSRPHANEFDEPLPVFLLTLLARTHPSRLGQGRRVEPVRPRRDVDRSSRSVQGSGTSRRRVRPSSSLVTTFRPSGE